MNPFNRHSRLRENLSAYIDGELSSSDALIVEKHLQTCQACRAELEGLRMTTSVLGDLNAADTPRSFALTPGMVAEPGPVAAPAPSRVLNTGMRLAAAGLAVALAAVMVVDRADFGGNGDETSNSGSSAVQERDLSTVGAGENLDSSLGGGASGQPNAAAPKLPAATAAPDAVTGTGSSGGSTGFGAVGAATAAPASPLPAGANSDRAATGDEPTGQAPAAAEIPPDTAQSNGNEAVGESLLSADDTGNGISNLELIEGLLAALLGAAIGGLIVLWIVQKRSSV